MTRWERVPLADRPDVDWTTAGRVAMLLAWDEYAVQAMFNNYTLNFSEPADRDRYFGASEIISALMMLDGIDPKAVRLFVGESIDPAWLGAALRAGLGEPEIRSVLATGEAPSTEELEVIAALRNG